MKLYVAIIMGAIILTAGFLGSFYAMTQNYIEETNSRKQAYIEEADAIGLKLVEDRAKEEEVKRIRRDPSSIGVLVNKKHPIEPLSFEPKDLANTNGATLSQKAVGDFRRMFSDAREAGQPFHVTSSYRSYDTQVMTYEHWVSVSGQSAADTYSAKPGYSEHQTGLVVDLAAEGCTLDCFGKTSQYKWLQQNAADYGFIQRYYVGEESLTGYKAEEWHYRYVGVEVAKDMKSKGIKSLEKYWDYPGGDYSD